MADQPESSSTAPTEGADKPPSPRASTPLGPHPQSPPKRPPSPIFPADSSAGSIVDLESNGDATEPVQDTQPDQDTSLQGLGIHLRYADQPLGDPPEAQPVDRVDSSDAILSQIAEPPADNETAVTASARQPEDAHSSSTAPTEPTAAAPSGQTPASTVPDWMTDELDESWREASQSNSVPTAAEQSTPTQQQTTDAVPPVESAASAVPATRDEPNDTRPPGPAARDDDNLTATIPNLGSVRLPLSGLGSRSASNVGAFFDARESLGVAGLRSSQLLGAGASAGAGGGYRRSRLGLSDSLTDTELERGPSTPSKRVPSHATRRAAAAAAADEDDSHSHSGSRSPASAPEDFESARGSMIDRTAMSAARHSPSAPADQSSSGDGRGTFIHRADVSSLPPILRPAWQSPQKKSGAAVLGGDMFTPMKLQTMFRTPTPPERQPQLPSTDTRSPSEGVAAQNREPSLPHSRVDPERTPRVGQSVLAEEDPKTGPSRQSAVPLPAETPAANRQMGSLQAAAQMPSSLFTFRTPQSQVVTPSAALRPHQVAARHVLSRQGADMASVGRPASAAAALAPLSPRPAVSTNMLSAPSTPHTPMRLFKFNYEDAATRARLELLVNRNGAPASGTRAAAETERERKRLRLDVKPRKVVSSGDLMSTHADALGADETELLPGPSAAVADRGVGDTRAATSQNSGPRASSSRASDQGEAGMRHSHRDSQASRTRPTEREVAAAASPSKSAMLPPVVDYVKQAPVYMSALQQQVMVRSVSDVTSSTQTWMTDEEDAVQEKAASGRQPSNDGRTDEQSFHQGSMQASPMRETKSPNRRWKQRRSAVAAARDADNSEELVAISRSPSGSPLRLSTRRLPQGSSLGPGAAQSAGDASVPPMASTLRSRKTWVSVSDAGRAMRDDESPRKLLRRYSAAALAEEELLSEGDGDFLQAYSDRARRGDSELDIDQHWSEESFRRDEKIKELEERLARRAEERRRAGTSWSQDQSRGTEGLHERHGVDGRDGVLEDAEAQRPVSRPPQYITLHEPTIEDVRDPTGSNRQEALQHIQYDDFSDTWEDEPEDEEAATAGGGPRRVQNGIILYDSEKVYTAGPSARGASRPLRAVASEAQLRVLDGDGHNEGKASRSESQQRRQYEELPAQAQHSLAQNELDLPRHPSSSRGSRPTAGFSSRYLSSGYGDDEARRGERTVSSNTLVDDRNRESYNSRISVDRRLGSGSSARNTFAFGGDPSAIANSLPGATITRKGSMLNISQIPDEEVEHLGGENLRYDKEHNRWVKVGKKASTESLRSQAAAEGAAASADHGIGDAAHGRGPGFGRRSTTRTPVEPTIPEASVETSQIASMQAPALRGAAGLERRSDRYGQVAAAPSEAAGDASASRSNSRGQNSRLSDSSDPFKDFESIGQSTTAADQSGADSMGKKAGDPAAGGTTSSKSVAVSADARSEGEFEAQRAAPPPPPSEKQRPAMTSAVSQPAFSTRATPMAAHPRVVSGPPAFQSAHRPINTMPRARSALRNVVNYSPDTTIRSSVSSATVTATVEQPTPREDTRATQARDLDRSQPAGGSHAQREGHGLAAVEQRVQAPVSPLPRLQQRDDRFAQVDGRRGQPATPERRNTAPNLAYLTPPAAGRPHLDTPPRSILKPSPSASAINGHRSASGDLYRQSPQPASANRTISFADVHTLHRYGGQQAAPQRRGGRIQAESEASDLSQSIDADWSEDDDDDDEATADHREAYRRGGTRDRADAISLALRQLADLTLEPETDQLGGAEQHEFGTPSARRRASSRTSARNATVGRSPWSYAALRRPRRVRDPYRDDYDEDEDDTYDELHGYPDMTLLTEASFNVAHDRILEVITDVEPWEPGWEELRSIDLSGRRVESCLRLKEFLPSLEEVKLDRNEVAYLTGLPSTLRSLSISRNRITQLASFGQLLNLERLDISHNEVESLSHLQCLQHLHTLIADHTGVSSLDGIDRLSGLLHVSLSGNALRGVNFDRTAWRDLETLNLSHNALITVRGLSTLRRLKSLNLDHNRLSRVDLEPSMPHLRALRVNGNASLRTLDVAPARRLRTLYADYCALDSIANLESLSRLDNLSMRQQVDARVVWPARHLRDTRRLFFSGNAFPQGLDFVALPSPSSNDVDDVDLRRHPLPPPPPSTPMVRFLNLVYLELAACQLTALPVELPDLAPNLRSLNLDHNLISSLPPLAGMQRLKRLSVVGCRIKKSKSIIKAVRGLGELQVIDTRTNPCTLGLYPPLMIPAGPGPSSNSFPLAGGGGGGGVNGEYAMAASHLPPVPNPAVVQPDRARQERKRAQREARNADRRADKSHFHKRQPPLSDPALYDDDDEGEDDLQSFATTSRLDGGGRDEVDKGGKTTTVPSITSLFLAADRRFFATLPAGFKEKRALHRGLLAMACPRLSWVDGLFVDEEEVGVAEELVQAQLEGR